MKNLVAKKLNNAIDGIREQNFTEHGIVDVLGSFVVLAGMVKSIMQSQAFKDVITSFNAKIREIVKPMMPVYKSKILCQFMPEFMPNE